MTNFDIIRRAVELEIKHTYINVRGKEKLFSQFMCAEIRKLIKESGKNPKWQVLYEYFENYSTDSYPDRKKAIERLGKVIRAELEAEKETKTSDGKLKPPSQTDVMYVKGVGSKIAYLFNKLNIFTANDLLYYFPSKHIDYSSRTNIKNLVEGTSTTIFGYIRNVSAFNSKSGLSVIKVQIADHTGKISLSFFFGKSNKYMLERTKAQFPKNAGIMVSGIVKLNEYDNQLTIDKPTYSIISAETTEKDNLNLGRIVPIYPMCDKLSPKILRKAIYNVINTYKSEIKNILPDFIIKKYGFLNKADAIEQIHFPKDMETLEKARNTLIFEEFFLIQLKLAIARKENEEQNTAYPLMVREDGPVMKFIKSLPFELTGAQKRAVNEILNDMSSSTPMQRLLQGDVGSGKTVVACIMLLAAIENGYQAAIMAPTEILAQQHYNNLTSWLTPLGISVGLFLGSSGKKMRTLEEQNIRNGQTKIAVGTHALIQDNVNFANLGAVVIDEQHRFGVKQRLSLRRKGNSPQVLTMTATPIPRTLAITLNGDLDLTIIDERPKGRKEIITEFTSSKSYITKLIREQINLGHQAYIVYPLIEESETLSAKAATEEAERWQNEVFPEFKIGLLHGKLKNSEKDEVMEKFKNKEFDILVSTTVVEVGVDVPNATVMVIESAERFGLSQLHQLRGRVGRSELQSYCILSSNTRNQQTRERLNIMTETNDGFIIAEKDLQLRGPGEFLGVRQSGLPDLIISDLVRDAKILELARMEAIDFMNNHDINQYPNLLNADKLTLNSDILGC